MNSLARCGRHTDLLTAGPVAVESARSSPAITPKDRPVERGLASDRQIRGRLDFNCRPHTLTPMRRRRIPIRFGIEPPPAWLGLVATLVAVAVGTLLVYPLKSMAPVVSLGDRLPAGDPADLDRLGIAARPARLDRSAPPPSTSSTSRRCIASRSPTRRTGSPWPLRDRGDRQQHGRRARPRARDRG